jgi:hypothetical protein
MFDSMYYDFNSVYSFTNISYMGAKAEKQMI